MKKLGKRKGARKKSKKNFKFQFFVLILLVAFIILNLYVMIFFNFKLPVTGSGVSATGRVSFEIVEDLMINITSPWQDYNYSFAIGEPLVLDLNVTKTRDEDLIWEYWLYDLRHNEWQNIEMGFAPNTTFSPVRWGNKLFVNASTMSGDEIVHDNVSFFVYVPNSAPIIYDLDTEFYTCEASQLVANFYSEDKDEDFILGSIDPSHSFFYVLPTAQDGTTTFFDLISIPDLPKEAAGGINAGINSYISTVKVDDQYNETCCVDTLVVNISVLEINNPPEITEIGVQTVWNKGEDSNFFHILNIYDEEYNLRHGDLDLDLTILNSSGHNVPLFVVELNATHSFFNFTANNQTPPDTYNVTLCVTDSAIDNPHPELLTYCNQTGASITSCESFTLTVTNENRPPTITNYYPTNLSFDATGTLAIYFNISKYDPDFTIPDAYWYVDGVLAEYDSGYSEDNFTYIFPCGISGDHKVGVNITDGLLNDSLTWNVSVILTGCPSLGDTGGGGGGGGGGGSCIPLWVCDTWGLCQNAEQSLLAGLLSGEDYRIIEDNCANRGLDVDSCGFQIRSCSDLNNCVLSSGNPEEIQFCHYTENPSCSDGIKNCHDGGCEFLVDCGGPCDACPTCTDGIKNQGEGGVDCGGPCPWRCIPAVPFFKKPTVIYSLLGLILIIIVFVIIKLIRVLQYKKGIGVQERKNQNL